jgi:hypothetical protein
LTSSITGSHPHFSIPLSGDIFERIFPAVVLQIQTAEGEEQRGLTTRTLADQSLNEILSL